MHVIQKLSLGKLVLSTGIPLRLVWTFSLTSPSLFNLFPLSLCGTLGLAVEPLTNCWLPVILHYPPPVFLQREGPGKPGDLGNLAFTGLGIAFFFTQGLPVPAHRFNLLPENSMDAGFIGMPCDWFGMCPRCICGTFVKWLCSPDTFVCLRKHVLRSTRRAVWTDTKNRRVCGVGGDGAKQRHSTVTAKMYIAVWKEMFICLCSLEDYCVATWFVLSAKLCNVISAELCQCHVSTMRAF